MKTSSMDEGLKARMMEVDPGLELWRCHQCGQCSWVCPSQRSGGIRTREVMERAILGSLDPAEELSIWLCTMCHSCTERCQLGADPARVIGSLRNLAAREGNIPEHFRKEAVLFVRTGLSFPVTGLTRKLRMELGLTPIEVSETAARDLRILVSRTGMGGLDLE